MRNAATVLALLMVSGCLQIGHEPIQGCDGHLVVGAAGDFGYAVDARWRGCAFLHDYWQGRSSAELGIFSFSLGPVPAQSPAEMMSSQSFRPRDGYTVPPGARYLNVVATWRGTAGAPAADTLELQFGHASGAGSIHVKSGKAEMIQVDPRSADAPHVRVSRWGFTLIAPPDQTAVGDLTIHALAGGDLPRLVYPDSWSGKNELMLYNESGQIRDVPGSFALSRIPQGTVRGPPTRFDLPEGQLVPPGTAEVLLRIRVNGSQWPLTDYAPTLRIQGPSMSEPEEPGRAPEASSDYLWVIPLNESLWDSPFEGRSDWRFFVSWPGAYLSEFKAYEGPYTIEIWACRLSCQNTPWNT